MPKLSLVIPFYKRLEAFRQSLEHNKKFASRDYEIVLVLDEPSEETGVIQLCKETPEFGWRVLINRQDHPWRNPSKPLNVGVRQARSETILVVSPETSWVTDVPGLLLSACDRKPDSYHLGTLQGNHTGGIPTIEEFDAMKGGAHYGAICVKKKHLEAINGYDESLIGWGGDDDNLRARLRKIGVSHCHNKEVRLVHPAHKETARFHSADTKKRLNQILAPSEAVANTTSGWGEDFNEVIYEA